MYKETIGSCNMAELLFYAIDRMHGHTKFCQRGFKFECVKHTLSRKMIFKTNYRFM